MKRIVFAFAALAAFQAAAITATKEYVDRKDTEIRTNTYTRAETDARIAELAPSTSLEPATNYTDNAVEIAYHDAVDYIDRVARRILTTNDVCNIVTNVVGVMIAPKQWGNWEWAPNVLWIEANGDTNKAYYCLDQIKFEDGRWEASYDERFWSDMFGIWDGDGWMVYGEGGEDAEEVTFMVDSGAHREITVKRKTSNAIGLARLSDIAPSVSNTVTKSFVEDLGIESGIQEESDPVWSSEKGSYATKQGMSAVSNIAFSAETKANTLISYVNGDDVMDVVTNYDSAVHISSRSLRQRVEDGGTNFWRVVWDEMNRWNWFLPQIGYQTNALWSALSEKADRAWGFYDSHTGGWSPDGYTQISSPKILIAAGMAYQRHVTTGGAVWVLESNGLVTEVGGVASNGFFRISDDDGNALFEIVKGNKRTVGSTAGAITLTNIMGITHCYIPYNVDAPEHPTIYATTALGTPFVSEESASSLVNVTWTGTRGDYHAEVWPKTASSSLFIKAEHETGGETYIKNTAPTGLDGGIMYNGIKYRVVPYSTGGKIYLTLEVL